MTNSDYEHHPFLEEGKIEGATKLILGSFPVYACTHAKPNQEYDGDCNLMFFYGSRHNDFWDYYSNHIDREVSKLSGKRKIVESLEHHKIAITDIILSCKRKGKSASDKDLFDRVYNCQILEQLLDSGVIKIICTSKGVLGMLEHVISKGNFKGKVNLVTNMGELPEKVILEALKGSLADKSKPISMIFHYKNMPIEVIAIPSPGSPYRGLRYFGYDCEGSASDYLSRYLEQVFKWFVFE